MYKDEKAGVYRVLVGKPASRNHLEDPDIHGQMILKCVFEKWNGKAWAGSICLRIGTGGWRL
jgi:hypothetical protein